MKWPCLILLYTYIRHISPLMFDVIYDKPEGFIIYKHEPVGRGFIHYHINHGRVYVSYIQSFITYRLGLRQRRWGATNTINKVEVCTLRLSIHISFMVLWCYCCPLPSTMCMYGLTGVLCKYKFLGNHAKL